jgi:hypothetical protein
MRDSIWNNRDHMTIDNRAGDHHDQRYKGATAPCVRAPYGPARCGSCVCGSCVPEVEVPCPRATLAAMIAAVAFRPRRSGLIQNGTVGSGLSGRISEARPILAPPGDGPRIFTIDIGARSLCGE